MDINQKLEKLLLQQKEITKDYGKILKDLSYDNLINENEILKGKVSDYENDLAHLHSKNQKLDEDLSNLRRAYNQQLLNEKTDILQSSKKKIQLYFEDNQRANTNKLKNLEYYIKQKLAKLDGQMTTEVEIDKKEFEDDISRIYSKLDRAIEEKRVSMQYQEQDISQSIDENYQSLQNEEISEEVKKKKEKYNNIELKIGLNLLNKVAVVIILIGVITAMRYTYSNFFNDYVKGIFVYLIGGLFLLGGEVFHRKDKKIFSLGLIGGGIGILYIATFVSYFTYNIISFIPSLLLAVIITGTALVLSLRYQAKTICGLSLLGGYLPFFSYYFTEGIVGKAVYISMLYLLLLNILVLMISIRKRWTYINYLSFLLNIPSMILLIDASESNLASIVYTVAVFVMYVMISLAYPVLKQSKLKIFDIILLGLNTLINAGILYELIDTEFRGLLALVFVLVYLGLGELLRRKSQQEKATQALFYITALTFSVLMIPFQFGIKWISLGWIAEGIALIYVARKLKNSKMEIAGWCVWIFSLLVSVADPLVYDSYYFDLKYATNIAAMIFVLSVYLKDLQILSFRASIKGKFLLVYKYYVLINTWIFLIYEACRYIDFIEDIFDRIFFSMVLTGLITMLFGFIICKISILGNKGIKIFATIQYIIGDFIAFAIVFYPISGGRKLEILAGVIIVLYNVLVFVNIKSLLMKLVKEDRLSYQTFPLLLALYALTSAVGFIIAQLDLGRMNLVVSIFVIIMALVYLVIGFRKNYIYLRRFGLGLAIFSFAKLFVLDLSYLDLLGKIIAYFSFGIILLCMSFVYQKLNNQLEGEKND